MKQHPIFMPHHLHLRLCFGVEVFADQKTEPELCSIFERH